MVGLFALAALVALAPAAVAQSIPGRIERLLMDPGLSGSRTGVVLLDPETGEAIAAVNADESLIPASNMKILTSGAALAVLGRDFRFRTELVHDPEAAGANGAQGRIVLRGSGDPALADPELLKSMKMTVEDLLDAWVEAIKKASPLGVGELVVDDRVFDRQFVHPTWPVQQLNRWYCAEVSGVNFHTNVLSIFTEPQGEGQPPRLTLEPAAPWLSVRNKARSVRTGNHTAWAARDLSTGAITLHGDIRWANDPVEVAMSDNAGFVGQLLADRLARAGLRPATVRSAEPDEDLTKGKVIHAVVTDLATVLQRCNVDSHNLYAEALIKRLGREVTGAPGSWSNGSAVLRMVLSQRLGARAGQTITVADGSGMSRENRVTPRMLASWLASLASDPALARPFFESLPEAGEEGTLKKRFRGKELRYEVRAKSGYLTGVSSLSGMVSDRTSGRSVVFSVITNDKPNRVSLAAVRDMEEQVVVLAQEWLERQAGAERPRQGG
ncbi:MAG TPA: D-alanyl-D-alanine carboxypeptidase/D-alanyl-D-alanine-endopeptidase [Phycisphaerales bacterium]|nr:D-alanyl-D-alanine carboxypeptidase/D-alanyl-D-alanine-endopeptidase [Phycisphaerales bacterium]